MSTQQCEWDRFTSKILNLYMGFCMQLLSEVESGKIGHAQALNELNRLSCRMRELENYTVEFLSLHQKYGNFLPRNQIQAPSSKIAENNWEGRNEVVVAGNASPMRSNLALTTGLNAIAASEPVRFVFRVNKSFLEYPNHPITIPRDTLGTLQRRKFLPSPCPNGWRCPITIERASHSFDGYLYTHESGWGPYAQIKVPTENGENFVRGLRLGQEIVVSLSLGRSGTLAASLSNGGL